MWHGESVVTGKRHLLQHGRGSPAGWLSPLNVTRVLRWAKPSGWGDSKNLTIGDPALATPGNYRGGPHRTTVPSPVCMSRLTTVPTDAPAGYCSPAKSTTEVGASLEANTSLT